MPNPWGPEPFFATGRQKSALEAIDAPSLNELKLEISLQ